MTVRDYIIDGDGPMGWRDVGIVLLAAILPPVVAVSLFGKMGAVAFIAAMPAFLAAKDAGLGISLLVTLVTGMGGMLALGDPVMALIVAGVLSAMTAVAFRQGLALPCLRALFTWSVFTGPIIPADNLPLVFTIYLAAMLWSLGVTWAFGRQAADPEGDPPSRDYSAIFGVALGAGLVLSVWVGNRFFGPHGFWFPLTFVVLWLPPFGKLFSRTAKRTLGTVLGTGVALGIAWVSQAVWVTAAAGAIALVLAFRFLPRTYTIFTALLTIAILEALSLVSDVDRLATERLVTMAAAAAMTITLGILAAAALRLTRPDVLRDLMDGEAD